MSFRSPEWPATSRRRCSGRRASDWLCQFIADIADIADLAVERPANLETTALGAAFFAGLATGVWSDLDALSRTWSARDCFDPAMERAARDAAITGWHRAVRQSMIR